MNPKYATQTQFTNRQTHCHHHNRNTLHSEHGHTQQLYITKINIKQSKTEQTININSKTQIHNNTHANTLTKTNIYTKHITGKDTAATQKHTHQHAHHKHTTQQQRHNIYIYIQMQTQQSYTHRYKHTKKQSQNWDT